MADSYKACPRMNGTTKSSLKKDIIRYLGGYLRGYLGGYML